MSNNAKGSDGSGGKAENREKILGKKKRRFFDKEDLNTINQILKLIKPYRIRVLLSIIFAALSVALTLYIPVITGEAVDLIVGEGLVKFPELLRLLVRMSIIILITAIFQWIMNHINNVVTYRVSEDVRLRAFNHLQELPISYLDSHLAGDLISRLITDIDQFSQGLLMGFTQLFTGVMTILGTLVIMFSVEPLIAFSVVMLTPLSLILAAFIASRTYHLFKAQSASRGRLSAYSSEILGNLKIVKAFSREDKEEDAFREINKNLSEWSMKSTFYSSTVNPSTRFVNALVYAVVAGFGAFRVIGGQLSVGQLSAFLSYANQYTKPFNEISGVLTELENALSGARRVFELIGEPGIPADAEGASVLKEAKGDVDIRNVSFSYDKSKKLLTDLNVDVKPGQMAAIVGPTGCGKSTLINLLMRFYDVDEGEIRIDGMDTKRITRRSLRENFGMVLQETWLKSASIRDNISYGCPEADISEIKEAARRAHCDAFIQKMEKGYDTVLSEDGGALSQGQKQLLCIARLMLRLPPMLILDEATSSIDTRTELLIQQAFSEMMKGRTSFVVAHRLSTIRNADIILVMKDGNIIESGRHEELLSQNGFYSKLYYSQFDLKNTA